MKATVIVRLHPFEAQALLGLRARIEATMGGPEAMILLNGEHGDFTTLARVFAKVDAAFARTDLAKALAAEEVR